MTSRRAYGLLMAFVIRETLMQPMDVALRVAYVVKADDVRGFYERRFPGGSLLPG